MRQYQNTGSAVFQGLEIIGHVALNVFTNYVNEALKTEIDFPRVHARKTA